MLFALAPIKLPVIEIRRALTGRFEMIEREDLASMSVLVHHRHVLGTTPTDDREDYLTKMLTSLYFARSPAKEVPFTPPNTTTLFYAKFLMVSSVGKLPISTIREINQDIDELVAQAERERQAKKEKFRFYQSVLADWNLGARLEYESTIANHDFQRKLVKIEDDGLRKYDLDYASSSALFRLKVQRGDTTSWLVVAPVGFNQNWRFPEEVVGGVPKRSLKPRVFEVDEAESQEPGGPTKE